MPVCRRYFNEKENRNDVRPLNLYSAIGSILGVPVMSKKEEKELDVGQSRNMTDDQWLDNILAILPGDVDYAKNDALMTYTLYDRCMTSEVFNRRIGIRRYMASHDATACL